MSDGGSDDEAKRRRLEKIANAPNKRGYGKPPVEHRFTKDGPNPSKGRPPGSKNRRRAPSLGTLHDVVWRHGNEKVRVTDSSGAREISRVEFATTALFAAGKNNHRAATVYLQTFERAEASRRALMEAIQSTIFDYKDVCRAISASDVRLSRTPTEHLPHPDHVGIDPTTGTMRIYGPSDTEEKEVWDAVIGHIQQRMNQDRELRELLNGSRLEYIRKIYVAMIDRNLRHVRFLRWWVEEYDGGLRCRDGHTPEELKQALRRFMPKGWMKVYRQSVEGSSRHDEAH